MKLVTSLRCRSGLLLIIAMMALPACSTGYKQPKPSALKENPAATPITTVWQHNLSRSVSQPLQIAVHNNQQLVVADKEGGVHALSHTGDVLWSYESNTPIGTGVGFDGNTASFVTQKSQLSAVRAGQLLWQVPLSSPAYTAPLVAGGRVFVLHADQRLSAYDAANGYKLWENKGTAPYGNLVLNQPSLLMAAKGALLVGVYGRVVFINPNNGTPLGEVPIASPRGATELAQVINVLAPAARVGDSLCARVFHNSVGCVTLKGESQWSQPSIGSTGIAADENIVVGIDNQGIITAWSRKPQGEVLWKNADFQYRTLSAPLIIDSSVLIGDMQGYVHVIDHATGKLRNRIQVDKSAISVAPIRIGNTAVFISRNGVISALQLR